MIYLILLNMSTVPILAQLHSIAMLSNYDHNLQEYIKKIAPSITDDMIDSELRLLVCNFLYEFCANCNKPNKTPEFKALLSADQDKVNNLLEKSLKKYISYATMVLKEYNIKNSTNENHTLILRNVKELQINSTNAFVKMNTLYHKITKVICNSPIIESSTCNDNIKIDDFNNIIELIKDKIDYFLESNLSISNSLSRKLNRFHDKLDNLKHRIVVLIGCYDNYKSKNTQQYCIKCRKYGRSINTIITNINYYIDFMVKLDIIDERSNEIPKFKLFIESNNTKAKQNNYSKQVMPNQPYKLLGNISVSACYGVEESHKWVTTMALLHKKTRRNICMFPIRILIDIVSELLKSAVLSQTYYSFNNKKQTKQTCINMLVNCPCCLNKQLSITEDKYFLELIYKSCELAKRPIKDFYDAKKEIQTKFISLINDSEYDNNTVYYCENSACSHCTGQVPIFNFFRSVEAPTNIGDVAIFIKSDLHCNKRKCPRCAWSKCLRCTMSPYHENEACRGKNTALLIKDTELDDESRKYLYLSCIDCPKCAIPIQKIDGCNHIICIKCKTHLCFRCSAILKPNNPYAHTCPPANYDIDRGVVFTRGDNGIFQVEEATA